MLLKLQAEAFSQFAAAFQSSYHRARPVTKGMLLLQKGCLFNLSTIWNFQRICQSWESCPVQTHANFWLTKSWNKLIWLLLPVLTFRMICQDSSHWRTSLRKTFPHSYPNTLFLCFNLTVLKGALQIGTTKCLKYHLVTVSISYFLVNS